MWTSKRLVSGDSDHSQLITKTSPFDGISILKTEQSVNKET